jgi:hypothetical protein
VFYTLEVFSDLVAIHLGMLACEGQDALLQLLLLLLPCGF